MRNEHPPVGPHTPGIVNLLARACWYARGVGVVFSPADHHGIWAAQREGTLSKGLVPDHFVTFLEGLAKSKGLI
jgi:hypothetical protein